MAQSEGNRGTGATNELAKERNRGAAERTMTAWIQNCIALIGFGVAVDQIARSLNRTLSLTNPVITNQLAGGLAVVFIGFAILLLVLALLQYRLIVWSIEHENYIFLPIHALNRIVLTAILIFGGLAIVMVGLSP